MSYQAVRKHACGVSGSFTISY